MSKTAATPLLFTFAIARLETGLESKHIQLAAEAEIPCGPMDAPMCIVWRGRTFLFRKWLPGEAPVYHECTRYYAPIEVHVFGEDEK